MVLLQSFKNIFLVPELRKRMLFTLGVLIICRVGLFIPVVGVDVAALANMMKQASALGGLLRYFDVISGGGLTKSTLFALGIGPYISASIMMQMLGMAVPSLEQLNKEGDYGRRMINQYTRYLTVGLSVLWSTGYATVLERNNFVLAPGWSFRILFIVSLTVGALFVMWLGEQISLHGIGNGSSVIIFSGIVARFPSYVRQTIEFVQLGNLDTIVAIIILLVFIAICACIVFLERGERKIPVQYARRVVGHRVYGGQSTYIPLKINSAGVMPVIFAGTVLTVPMQIAQLFSDRFEFLSAIIDPRNPIHMVVEFLLIMFFSFFFAAIVINPDELAANMKKSGGFIPGIRPGRKTVEYFFYLLNRIGLVGAIYLAVLDLFPNILNMLVRLPFYLGGTSLLICVGVALDLATQIESYLVERRYEGFLTSGKMRGRR
ncbi:preprotein translocase subunit SecY [Candidatus Babeliales bacterium]|nr:preprotein translocase subunit SecY [Candidatus Babeliales bacterium]